MNALKIGKLCIKPSSVHGFGVFAAECFRPGQIIEECYTLVVNDFPESVFDNYVFRYQESQLALPLGAGAIYNHADKPNANYEFDTVRSVMVLRANQVILKDEEIFISYGKNWFSARKLTPQNEHWQRRLRYWLRRSPLVRFVMVLVISGGVLGLLKTL